uniref:Uncharacterized protein n=1 Tax=Dicentrarchus labrax TaxID=13489 RepID=A0A8P4GMH4_DICLA
MLEFIAGESHILVQHNTVCPGINSLSISLGFLPDCNHIDCQSHQRPLGFAL